MEHLENVLANARTSKRHYAMVVIAVLIFGGLFWVGYQPWKARQNRLFAATTIGGAACRHLHAGAMGRGIVPGGLL